MCGIYGYFGNQDAKKQILAGLKRLEYRGYDSWGIAVKQDNNIHLTKLIGKIGDTSDIEILPVTNLGIGHTRWATHGGVTDFNAHPHYSTDKSFVVAQNGIVQNYQELKTKLINLGYNFITQTDTEVIVYLIEEYKKSTNNLFEAVIAAFNDLTGRNTIIVLNAFENEIIATRNGSPLVVGLNTDTQEIFFSSDTLSFAPFAHRMYVMENDEIAYLSNSQVNIFNVRNKNKLDLVWKDIDVQNDKVDKEGYDHFMLKEIVEQQSTIKEAVQYTQEELQPLLDAIANANTVYTVGAGTASYAAAQIAFYLRRYAHVKAIELRSYEMDSYKDLFTDQDIIIAVSQSGETADTIEALEYAKNKGAKIASIVNMYGSTITRMSDYAYLSRSGPEICVASTKAFTAQIAWGYLLTMSLIGRYNDAKQSIYDLAHELETYFQEDLINNIKDVAEKVSSKEHFFILGRGQNYSVALEGSLKVKEITYKHFEGFAGGELKHGVIALIEKGTPVFVIVSDDDDKDDMISAAEQVKARGALVVGVGQIDNPVFDEYLPAAFSKYSSPIANVIPFQLVSYFLGILLKRDPDKPRNLAKSVTVK